MQRKIGIQLRGSGRALKPSGPGVIRPKPQDRYGQPFKPKPIRPGKKDGGKVIRKYPDGSDIPRPLRKKPLSKEPLRRKGVDTKTLKEKIKESRDKLRDRKKQPRLRELEKELGMKKGGRAKFPDLTGDGKVTRADILKGRGVFASGGRPGLYANIHAKRKRGGRMRKKGAKGAPTAANFARAKQTARK